MSRISGSPRECGGRAEHDGVPRGGLPDPDGRRDRGSSASGRVMRTRALADSSESPTSRPTRRGQTTSVSCRRPSRRGRAHTLRDRRAAARAPWSSAPANERRRDRATPCQCGQRPAPSAERLVAQGAVPAGGEVGRGVQADRDAEGQRWSFSLHFSVVAPRETAMWRYPPPVRWRHGDGDDSDARSRGSGRARSRASAL
jgi:hypothetical protein